MAPRKPPPPTDEDDELDEEDVEDEDDEEDGDDDEDDDEGDEEAGEEANEAEGDEADDDIEPPSAPASAPATTPPNGPPELSERQRRRARSRSHPRGHGGMGRPPTGPAPKSPPRAEPFDVNTMADEHAGELAPDISSWPGTAEAAKLVGRHTSTLKMWRSQGRISAIRDGSGCWRYNPDDLAEAMEVPDATDPGTVLATGMTAIVQQGANANERLLAMTELATEGLKDASVVLSQELQRAYARIADLEKERVLLLDKSNAGRAEDLRHDRLTLRMKHKHELDLEDGRKMSERLEGLLTIIGPIAASIGARLIGNITGAEKLEAAVAGAPAPQASTPAPSDKERLVPFETRITDAMARLCAALRNLEGPAFQGLRAMLPPKVAEALDDVIQNQSDSTVGKALAVIIQAAQGLSELQFRAISPIAPADVVAILAELRTILRSTETSTVEDARP